MICYYHRADLDGHCSGAIIYDKFPECVMIGVDYKDKLEKELIGPGMTVYVVDFSFSREEMIWLNENANLIWIDHHDTAIRKMEGENIVGLRNTSKAACELTWGYLHRGCEMNPVVRMLGLYDVWDHEHEDVLPFQYGMRSYIGNTHPTEPAWRLLLKPHMNRREVLYQRIISAGNTILSYERRQNEMVCKGMHWVSNFHGYRALIMNRPYSNSKVFDSVYDPELHDIMILFGVKNNSWKYSLYCNKEDIHVGNLAVEYYGGGGHRGAAGFYTDHYIFK